MKLFVAIHVPEKFGSRPAFIDDFGLPAKKAPFSRLWWKRLHRERVGNGQLPLLREVEDKLVPCGERVYFPMRQPPPLVMKEYWRLNYPLCRLPPRLSNIQKPNDNKASNHVHQP
jgi:hypothetical protein